MKECSKCKIEKVFDLFDKNKSNRDGLQSQCKDCRKEYRLNNKDKLKEQNRNYYLNNTEKVLESNKNWSINNRKNSNEIKYNYYQNNKDKYNKSKKIKYHSNKLFSLKERLRSRISIIFGKYKYKKNSKTEELLGISYEDMILYIESKFVNNMNWNNRNLWHIDHIIPLSSANTEEELIKLCHYTNLQPLWAKDNLLKSNKIL